MTRAGEQLNELSGSAYRHRAVPLRVFGDKLVVARPLDGAPVVLAPTAATVWRWLDDWATAEGLGRQLAEAYPAIATGERESTIDQILAALTDDDLLERT